MALPDPVPGLVIRYSYLWRDEKLRQREEGSKDRPCLIVLAVQHDDGGMIVTVAPVTRRLPTDDPHAIELQPDVKRRLGLDDDVPSWIVTNELNRFAWPGPDVRPIRAGSAARFSYGLISRSLFLKVKAAVLQHIKEHTLFIGRRR